MQASYTCATASASRLRTSKRHESKHRARFRALRKQYNKPLGFWSIVGRSIQEADLSFKATNTQEET